MVTQNQWGEIAGTMGTWIMNYRDLVDDGLHVHFIAQDRLTESDSDDDEDSVIDPIVGPRLSPSVAAKVNAAVKVIGNTYISEVVSKKAGKIEKEDKWRMRLGPHAYYITKIRKPKRSAAPKFLDDPKFDDIVKIMQGTYGDAKKKSTKKKTTGKKRTKK